MPSIAEILQSLIDSVEGMNPTRLARETGVPQPTIRRILVGESLDPDTATLRPLAERFGRTVAHLRGEIPLDMHVAAEGLPYGVYYFPKSYEDVVAGLGSGRFNDHAHVEIEGKIAVPNSEIIRHGWHRDRLVVVETKGLSMHPTLYDGQAVVVNLDETRVVPNPITGEPQIYAIEDEDNGLRIKRLSRQNDGRILVTSDNENKMLFPPDYITPESSTRIVGRVCYRAGVV